jgi:hypothetical protein
MKENECTSSESLLPIKPFTTEQMASIKNLKNPSHTPNLLLQFRILLGEHHFLGIISSTSFCNLHQLISLSQRSFKQQPNSFIGLRVLPVEMERGEKRGVLLLEKGRYTCMQERKRAISMH